MNNPEMYNNKKKNWGLKYYLIYGAIFIVALILIISATTKAVSHNYDWNVNQLCYAFDNDDSTNVDEKYGFDINTVYEIKVNLDNFVSNVNISYIYTSDSGKKYKASATCYWFTKNEELTNELEKYFNNFDELMKNNGVSEDTYSIVYNDKTKASIWSYVLSYAPMIIIIIVGIILFKNFAKNQMGGQGGQSFDFGKSKARLQDNSKVRFKDVAGCDDEKEEMKELVDYLKNPTKYSQAGARIPKGVILKGQPGTGKTLLAKAIAGEANVPFFYISGSDFLELYVGVGAARVRDMFAQARKNAPCIIFIDEIDAIGRQRGTGLGGGHDEREQTLNQMLVEMDGFEQNSGVIVLAATNRIDILDPALLRPGRFDRQIEVSLPDLKGRIAILKVHSRNKKFASDVSLDSIASRTPGFSGAQLENVLNEASILSVRNGHSKISVSDVDEAIDRVLAGPAKKTKVMSEKSKRNTAYHEAGHAVVGLKFENAQQVQKITIIPRGEALGYVMTTPKDESMNQTKSELEAEIVSYLAGRASEEIFFDDVTTGAYDDIRRATNIARIMVTELGMSSLGPIHYEDSQQQVFLGRDYGHTSMSEMLAKDIDTEVRKIIFECLEKAKKVINENKELLTIIAEALIKYETITKEEVDFLVKYNSLDAFDAYKKNSEELAKKSEALAKEEDNKETNESIDNNQENKEENTDEK